MLTRRHSVWASTRSAHTAITLGWLSKLINHQVSIYLARREQQIANRPRDSRSLRRFHTLVQSKPSRFGDGCSEFREHGSGPGQGQLR